MWANEQAVVSCFIILFGGAIAVSEGTKQVRWYSGAYGIAISLLILIIEWPRSKRTKGHTMQRPGQWMPAKIVKRLGVFGRNYFVRFVFYLLACVPCGMNLGTVMGGLSLLCACVIYLVAAINGESWTTCEQETQRRKTLTRIPPPSYAPPRRDSPQVTKRLLSPTRSEDGGGQIV